MNSSARKFPAPLRLLGLLLAVGFPAGGTARARDLGLFPVEYKPDNIFAVSSFLPLELQRVAVLPLACDESKSDLLQGCEALTPVLLGELNKTKKFEVVPVNAGKLRKSSGKSGWTGTEVLPADFFESLRRTYGCDAVLFSQLTVFRAYAPLAVGWRFKLVDARTKQTLWCADEVFDAGLTSVSRGSSHYHLHWFADSQPDDWLQKNSPRQFGQYAAAKLFATLPDR